MRRKDREITDPAEKLRIIGSCKVCRLGMSENNRPYVVPLNFGYVYENGTLALYFHGAREGKKIGILKNNPEVCFEMDGGHALIEGKEACDYSYAYESVVGFGTVEFLEDGGEKSRGLNILMKHQTGKDTDHVFNEHHLKAVAVYRLRAVSFTGKRRLPPPS